MSSGSDAYDRALHTKIKDLKDAVTSLAEEKMKLRQRLERALKEIEVLRESREDLLSTMEDIVTNALNTAVHVKMDKELNQRKLKVWDGEIDEDEE